MRSWLLSVVGGLAVSPAFFVAAQGATGPSVWISARVQDSDGNPVGDAVVFVYETKDESFPPPKEPYVVDQVHQEFVPHLLPIPVGSKVRFPNKDNIHHDIYSFSPAKTFELPLYKGEPAEPVLFDKPGIVELGCNIHDWMRGVILVLPNPYFAKTDASGKVSMAVPSRKDLELAVFHERLKGPVGSTRRRVPDSGAVAWRLNLRPEHRKKRPAVGYQ